MLAGLAALILTFFLKVWVLKVVWGLVIAPNFFDGSSLTYRHSFFIVILAGFLMPRVPAVNKEEEGKEKYALLSRALLAGASYLLFLGFCWILHIFM